MRVREPTVVIVAVGLLLWAIVSFVWQGGDFFKASFYDIATIGVAVWFAYYLTQRQSDSRKCKEITQQAASNMKGLIWRIAKYKKLTRDDILVLCTRCENQMNTLKSFVNNDTFEQLGDAWEGIGFKLLMEKCTVQQETDRYSYIISKVNRIDRICDEVIVDLWIN